MLRIATVALLSVGCLAGQRATDLFERTVEVFARNYFDRDFLVARWPELVARYRSAVADATTPAQARALVHALLGEVPASHLALLSAHTHRRLEAELAGRRTVMLGCQLVQSAGRFFVDAVLDDGPAARAGLRAGDEVVALDDVPVAQSSLLDWRSDDAALADPPMHDLVVDGAGAVAVTLRSGDVVAVAAARWSALDASRASVRVLAAADQPVLYVHLWFVFHDQAARLLRRAIADHPECAGLLLDLRGRGGSAAECAAIVDAAKQARERGMVVVALVDARTRSAKEVVAHALQQSGDVLLVGERTAGAVLPATFVPLTDDAVLMLPATRLGRHSAAIEGRGVTPDVAVGSPVPAVPGADPILDAGRRELAALLMPSRR